MMKPGNPCGNCTATAYTAYRSFYTLLLAALILAPGLLSGQIVYPAAPLSPVTDTIFGTIVPDPYRSLEDDSLESTHKWLAQQEKLTNYYLDRAVVKYELLQQFRINSYVDYPSFAKSGAYYFCFRKSIDAPDASLYLQHKMNTDGNVIANPAHYLKGRNDRVAIKKFAVSEDNDYIAFSVAHRGSDWQEIHIKQLHPVRELNEVIPYVKFSNIVWSGNGFYYMRYSHQGDNALTGISDHAAICYHKIGTKATTDSVVYKQDQDPLADLHFEKTGAGEFLIIYDDHREDNEQLSCVYALALNGKNAGTIRTIVRSAVGSYEVLGMYRQQFLVKASLEAPRGRLLLFSADRENDAEEFVPQYKEVLHDATIINGKVVCTYLDDIDYAVVTFDSTGKPVNSISYPSGTSVSSFIGLASDSIGYFYCHSFLLPPVVYEYNLNTYAVKPVAKTEITYDERLFTVDKVHYTSKDGTQIPMMIARKKDFKKDGQAPAVLYGYGGNGVVMTPFFNRNFISHLQNGGIVALPCIRGGNEFGEDWHRGGARSNKQNVFDDFIAAAEYLGKEQYTSSSKLALMGGSNGGLLVAAVLNQRPDICKAAVAERGVYDMLRFEKYTIGHAWQSEYGYKRDSLQLGYLYAYSPLHKVKNGLKYPAVLITTADHDDRVVPMHSYKYTAALQANTASDAPVLLRVEKNAGHQTSSITEDVAIFSFIYEQLGVKKRSVGVQN